MSNYFIKIFSIFSDKIKFLLVIFLAIISTSVFCMLYKKFTFFSIIILIISFLLEFILIYTIEKKILFIKFIKESLCEVKKIVWPKPKETIQMTITVFSFVLFMAFFLRSVDKFLEFFLYNLILR
ncbi:preprotein translocase subunit SecE [Candidatus Profftella armatura]